VKNWVKEDFRRSCALTELFRRYDISLTALNNVYFLDEAELRTLARHPLATIGAHTNTHAALALLPDAEARGEMEGNKRYLETLLDHPIHHFAYPFGAPGTFDKREVGLAAGLGFRTAVTAQTGVVLGRHRRTPHRIPRMELSGTSANLDYCFDVLDNAKQGRTTA
jgi:peptidoglycan/xylan/chitin deacetylase (PgdA/CDA1 family)